MRYFLGIEIAKSKDGLFISQKKYVFDIFHVTGIIGCKPCKNPIDPNYRIEEDEGDRLSNIGMYQ